MAGKQNMYVGMNREIEKILSKINECIVVYSLHEDGFKEIIGTNVPDAKDIRDEVANMQGKLQILLKGLDRESLKREKYENALRYCNEFLNKSRK